MLTVIFDSHTHTVNSDGRQTVEEMCRAAAEKGVAGITITDHADMNFYEARDHFNRICKSVSEIQAEKEKYAGQLEVLCGVELHLNTSPNDYLLYNFNRAFLTAREDLFDLTPAAFYAYAKQHGVTVVQAHPLRDGICVPTVDCADALEAFNPNPRHENHSALACELAKLYKLPISGGSDAHREEDVARGGVLTATPILSAADYVYLLKNGAVQPIEGV